MRAFIAFLEPTYTPPNRHRIGNSLLTECYNETRAKVLENIRNNDFINVFINKSSITVRERMINYCVIIKSEYFCMKQVAVKIRLSIIKSQAEFLDHVLDDLKKELR
jgi:hypothetical protein